MNQSPMPKSYVITFAVYYFILPQISEIYRMVRCFYTRIIYHPGTTSGYFFGGVGEGDMELVSEVYQLAWEGIKDFPWTFHQIAKQDIDNQRLLTFYLFTN